MVFIEPDDLEDEPLDEPIEFPEEIDGGIGGVGEPDDDTFIDTPKNYDSNGSI